MRQPKTNAENANKVVKRRQALQSLGALAVMGSAFGSSCSSNDKAGSGAGGGGPAGGSGSTGGTRSTGGSAGTGGSVGSGGSTGSGGSPGTGGSAGSGGSEAGAGGNASDGSADSSDAARSEGGAMTDGRLDASALDAGNLVVPPWDDVPTCMAISATDGAGQGPFFIHDLEKNDDISLYRQDIRGQYNTNAATGVEMQLHLRILSSASTNCRSPILVPGVDVYIWHTDAQGFYSGFGTRGTADEQKPDSPYMGIPSTMNLDTTERFCRGVLISNADGVVSFRSVFPGWYNGRVLHIHVIVFKRGSSSIGRGNYSKQNAPAWLFTTQFYFDKAFTQSVHSQYEPYQSRTTLAGYDRSISSGKMGTEPASSGLIAKASLARDLVTAQMQIVLDPA